MPQLAAGRQVAGCSARMGTHTEPGGPTELKSQRSAFWEVKRTRVSRAEYKRGEMHRQNGTGDIQRDAIG